MEIKNKRRVALAEMVLMIAATFAFAYLINESSKTDAIVKGNDKDFLIELAKVFRGLIFSEKGLVSAQDLGVSTCLESKTGELCQEFLPDECNSKCSDACVPAPRADVDACRIGTCFDPVEGTCQSGSPKQACLDFGGRWLDDPYGNVPQCQKGCCWANGDTSFGTEEQCNRQSELLGVDVTFYSTIRNELGCLLLAGGRTEGACVTLPDNEGEKNNCAFLTQTECDSKGGDFYAGYLCSHPDLDTKCEKQATAQCFEDKDEVMWFDSCGNKENVYDADRTRSWNNGLTLAKNDSCLIFQGDDALANQKTCGNCISLLGSRCGPKTDSESLADSTIDFVCRDLSCIDDDGNKRENGESWCVYQSSIGTDSDNKGKEARATDVPGSRQMKKVCVDGEVINEPCADYRGEICVESQTEISSQKSFSTAACRINRWQECLLYNKDVKTKGAGAKQSKADRDAKCNANSDCFLKKVNVDEGFNFDVCVPRYPAGFNLEANPDGAESVCGFANQQCTVIYVKDITGWECVYNCDCESAKFTTQMNDLCMSLGDCGASANIAGDITYNYIVKGAPKLTKNKNYNALLLSYVEAVKGKFADPGNLSEFGSGTAGTLEPFQGEGAVPDYGSAGGLGGLGSIAGMLGPGLSLVMQLGFGSKKSAGGAAAGAANLGSAVTAPTPTGVAQAVSGETAASTIAGSTTAIAYTLPTTLTGDNIPFSDGFHLFDTKIPTSDSKLFVNGYYVTTNDVGTKVAYPVTTYNNFGVDTTYKHGFLGAFESPITPFTNDQLAAGLNRGELSLSSDQYISLRSEVLIKNKISSLGNQIQIGDKTITGPTSSASKPLQINYKDNAAAIDALPSKGNLESELSWNTQSSELLKTSSVQKVTLYPDAQEGTSVGIGHSGDYSDGQFQKVVVGDKTYQVDNELWLKGASPGDIGIGVPEINPSVDIATYTQITDANQLSNGGVYQLDLPGGTQTLTLDHVDTNYFSRNEYVFTDGQKIKSDVIYGAIDKNGVGQIQTQTQTATIKLSTDQSYAYLDNPTGKPFDYGTTLTKNGVTYNVEGDGVLTSVGPSGNLEAADPTKLGFTATGGEAGATGQIPIAQAGDPNFIGPPAPTAAADAAVKPAADATPKSSFSAMGTAMAAIGVATSLYSLFTTLTAKGPKLVGNVLGGIVSLGSSVIGLLVSVGVLAGPAGWIASIVALAVSLILKLLGVGKTKKVIVKFTCEPWQAPTGGDKCTQCGEKGFPCSVYACSSLGQTCAFVNEGTGNELCINANPNDSVSPVITPWEDVTNGTTFSYTDITSGGYKLVSSENDGCIKSYQNVKFGISVSEAAQCRLDVNHTESFEDMEFNFGESSLYLYNHSMEFVVPDLASIGIEGYDPNARGDYQFYVRCQDYSGNLNENEYTIDFCIRPGDDTEEPVVVARDPDVDYVAYDAAKQDMSIITQEPTECKWDIADREYDEMSNVMECDNGIDQQLQLGWACFAELPVNSLENTYYVRCRDQPWLAGVNETARNTMSEGYSFTLRRTAENLNIYSFTPDNETLTFGTVPFSVPVEAKTAGGYDGTAVCTYFIGNQEVNFAETGGDTHRQVFNAAIGIGNRILPIRCVDAVGNVAERTAHFNIELDQSFPKVTRVYSQSGNLIIVTDEDSECAYSIGSCSFNFENATAFYGENTYHSALSEVGKTQYVKCRDKFGNSPGGCSIVVKQV